jgi:AsmA protein
MRVGRIVALGAAALVAVLLVIIVALKLFVHPDNYRGKVQEAVRRQTGRELTIGGKLELKVFPWLALAVHDVSLGNPPGFGSQPFMRLKTASIGVHLLPLLLSRRLEVSRIVVDGLTVNLVKRGTTNNWQDLTESKGTSAQTPANQG